MIIIILSIDTYNKNLIIAILLSKLHVNIINKIKLINICQIYYFKRTTTS